VPADSPRLGNDPPQHRLIDPARNRRADQRDCRTVGQRSEHKFRKAVEVAGPFRLTFCEQDHDRLDLQPPGHERQHLRRRPVQPLRVVRDTQQRLGLGGLGQERQHPEADQEAIELWAGPKADCGFECFAMRWLKVPETLVEGRAHEMQGGIGKLPLRFHPPDPDDPVARGLLGGAVQQSGLAYAAVSPQRQNPRTLPRPRVQQELIDSVNSAVLPTRPSPDASYPGGAPTLTLWILTLYTVLWPQRCSAQGTAPVLPRGFESRGVETPGTGRGHRFRLRRTPGRNGT